MSRRNEPDASAPEPKEPDAKEAEAKAATKKADEAPESIAQPTTKSPISTTGDSHVYRTDLGESLPPQKKPGVE